MRTRHDRRSERGAATVFAIACLALLLLLGAALGVVTAMVRAHRAAQSAADLAALAAATSVGRGTDPCAAATDIARQNGAEVTGCVLQGREVRVRVEVAGPHWLGQSADLGAEARAGPADRAGG